MAEEEKAKSKLDEFKKVKSKYWVAVCYPDNMKLDWETVIGDLVELPYCYCVHTMDRDMKSEQRKDHVHIMICFPNTTTGNNAYKVFDKLSAPGVHCLSWCEQVINVRSKYEYLIHNTETCRKQGKELYDKSCRISGNNFDIGSFEQLSVQDKMRMTKELCSVIRDNNILNFMDFFDLVDSNFDDAYFEVFQTHSGLFERMIKGNYQKKYVHSSKFLKE